MVFSSPMMKPVYRNDEILLTGVQDCADEASESRQHSAMTINEQDNFFFINEGFALNENDG
jgi:hypothetical protein